MPCRSLIEIQDLLSYTYVQLQKLCFGQVVQPSRRPITYFQSLFQTPSNNLHSTHNDLLCKNPGNESPLVAKNEKFNI